MYAMSNKSLWIGLVVWILLACNLLSSWSGTKQFATLSSSPPPSPPPSSSSSSSTDERTHVDPRVDWDDTERIARHLDQQNATRSANHTKKFRNVQNVALFRQLHKRKYRYTASTYSAAGVQITNAFAYVHIWKSGGTTIEKQAQNRSFAARFIQRYPYALTFVRDPVDHFLSGWSECMFRWHKNKKNKKDKREASKIDAQNYSQVITTYLENTRRMIQSGRKTHGCNIHSLPQVNFLFDRKGKLYSNLKIIGDISEMGQVMGAINFTYRPDVTARVASTNTIKQTYFPAKREWLRNETLQAICEFVALDYFMLDYQLPDPCRRASPGTSPLLRQLKLIE